MNTTHTNNTPALVIANIADTGDYEIHAAGCQHVHANVRVRDDWGRNVTMPKYRAVRDAGCYGDNTYDIRVHFAAENDGLWITKTAGCATGGRGKNHPVPADIDDYAEGDTAAERAEWIIKNWMEVK